MRLCTVRYPGIQAPSTFCQHFHHVVSQVTTENKRDKRERGAYGPTLNCLGFYTPQYKRVRAYKLTSARERGNSLPLITLPYLNSSCEDI